MLVYNKQLLFNMHGMNIKVIKITIYDIEPGISRNAKEDIGFNFEREPISLTFEQTN